MNIRRAALLVAIGLGLGLFRFVYVLSVNVYIHGMSPTLATVGLFAAGIAGTLFFASLYGEASRLTGANTRVKVAMAAALLMFVQVICSGREMEQLTSASMLPHVFSAPVVLTKLFLFGFIFSIGWVMLFLAFTERPRAFLGAVTPKLAGFVAVMSALNTVAAYVFPASSQHGHGSPFVELWSIGVALYTSISLVIFFVVLWREWDFHLTIHEIVVRGA